MVEKVKNLLIKYDSLIRYVFVGGLTTFVNMGIYALLCYVFDVGVTVSNIISVAGAIIFAYIANKIFVFRSHCSNAAEVAAECLKFVGARISTMIIEVGGVFLLVNILKMDKLAGKLATQIIVLIGNYFISKFLVFKKGAGKE